MRFARVPLAIPLSRAALLEETGAEGIEPRGMPQGGMMRGPAPQDLKALGPNQQVVTIRYCGDTYQVTTAGGETLPFWEFNLRFKTDSSDLARSRVIPSCCRRA